MTEAIGPVLPSPEPVPLVPGLLYGLRTWALTGERGAERLRGPYSGAAWPDGGRWLHATCEADGGHAVPVAGCSCGVYGWHPTHHTARRVLAVRREIAGVVETRGAAELHADGFRAEQGRPSALVAHRRSNPHLIRRLAVTYGVPIVEIRNADALLAWCLEHDIGLSAASLEALLGRPVAEKRRLLGHGLRSR
jgi:hypothetical protein